MMENKSIKEALGKQLRAFRENKGISVYRIAKKGNIRIDQVKAIEEGEKNYTIDAFLGYIAGSDLYIFFSEKDNTNDTHDFNENRKRI